MKRDSLTCPRVGIVGGGLAGLAAAVALIERGCAVELLESKRTLGGRAGSFQDRTTGERIDHCQHVAMGCCTNFLDFCRRTGIQELLQRHEALHFFGPTGGRCDFRPARWLPAPLHLLPALLRLSYLSLGDKLAIGRAMLRLIRTPATDVADGPTVLSWLREQRQGPQAIERFWQVVLVSALGESLDLASLVAARKVFLDGFLAHPDACHVHVPRVSLSELYDNRVASWLRQHGAAVQLEAPVAEVHFAGERVTGIRLTSGEVREFDFAVLAVPWRRVGELLAPELRARIDPGQHFECIAAAPITSLHFWFDRELTELPHAVFVGRLAQWIFASQATQSGEHYYQVVISASHDLAGRERQSVVDEVLGDLRSVFPAARAAQPLRWQLITQPESVFSVRPGLDLIRPLQQTPIANLLLAGDWTRTGWPATMEGAVRSGYLAAEAVLAQLGRPERIIVPDLPRNPLVRLLAGPR